MTMNLDSTITITLTHKQAGIISSALKYAGDMQEKYSIVEPNCFRSLHTEWNKLLEKCGNEVLSGVHTVDSLRNNVIHSKNDETI